MTRESDPLPYVQVDRAVKPKAALLANALGVTTQHALGSLVEWWELCGDPRELEAIAQATPLGEEPAVVLDATDAAARFQLASGKAVEPVLLARLGLLEPRPEGRYRVRGMSRFFAPITQRLHNRRIAQAGGLASAAARKAATGTAQPVGGKGSKAGSDVGSDVGSVPVNHHPKRNRTRNGSATEPGTEPPTEAQPNTADSGQRAVKKTGAGAPPSDCLKADFREATGTEYLWQGAKDGVALAELLRAAPLEEVRARWRRALRVPESEWKACRTVAELKSKWNHHAGSVPVAPVPLEHRPGRRL